MDSTLLPLRPPPGPHTLPAATSCLHLQLPAWSQGPIDPLVGPPASARHGRTVDVNWSPSCW
eukprot:363795-Chlamydomonas_euryale.AAC.12